MEMEIDQTNSNNQVIMRPSKLNQPQSNFTNIGFANSRLQSQTSQQSNFAPQQQLIEPLTQIDLSTKDKYDAYIKKIQTPSEYLAEITQCLKDEELINKINPFYMKEKQNDINEKMRAILTDWLIDVHHKFQLQPDTLFITLKLIDRYLSTRTILRSRLQLLGISCLLIACKFEEIYIPELKDFIVITDKAYTGKEIIEMERDVLNTLDFVVYVPTSYRFFELYSHFLQLNEKEFQFGRYLMESFLCDNRINKYNTSIVALAALYITMKVFRRADYQKIYNYTNDGDSQVTIKECGKDMLYFVENYDTGLLKAAKKKFSSKVYLEVANIPIN